MYQCPNCSGNMKFYIPSQMLRCDYCETEMDPYAFHKEKDAEESTYFDVTVFTCPQCGGELLSTENEATAFCSFCGASNILTSRLSTEKRPTYIVPFQKTKEDCKKAFAKMMKGAIYAPKELKDPDRIDGFRGIYMPYWFYNISQQGPADIKASKTYRRGDYMISDYYDLSCEIDGEYNGIPYDGSSSFADNLSQAIAPYDVRKAKAFSPAFLSGFYADTADVDKELYRTDALEIATDTTYDKLKKTPEFKGFSLQASDDTMAKAYAINSRCASIDSAMLPVWFLSYRKGDRVAYATVNGQTGKVAADLPIDSKKYLFGSVLTAIPIFILLNMFFTVIPSVALIFSMVLAVVALILYSVELSQIKRKDAGTDDKGLMSKKQFDESQPVEKKKKKQKKNSALGIFIIIVFFANTMVPLIVTMITLFAKYLWVAALAGGIAASIVIGNNLKGLQLSKKRYGYIGAIASIIISTLVLVLNPVADAIYYAGVIVSIIAIFFSISDLIYYYNILATRRLPQFDHTGGDDRA